MCKLLKKKNVKYLFVYFSTAMQLFWIEYLLNIYENPENVYFDVAWDIINLNINK